MEQKPDPLKDQFDRTRKGLEEHWAFKRTLATVKMMSQAVQQLRDEGMDITMETRPGKATATPFARGTIGMEGREYPFTVGYDEYSRLSVELKSGDDVFASILRDRDYDEAADAVFQTNLRTQLIQLKMVTEMLAAHDVGTRATSIPKPRASGGLKP